MKNTYTSILLLSACLALAHGASALPTISNVALSVNETQRRATITYELAGGPAIVTADILPNGVSIGEANCAGMCLDVNKLVTNGGHEILWLVDHGGTEGLRLEGAQVEAKLTAWRPETPPDYLVVGLNCRSNVLYFTSTNALPGGLQNDAWRTTHIVMRKIPAANKIWTMGAPPTEPGYQESTETNHLVKLTQNYYMGVFEITQKQYKLLVGYNPSTGTAREDADVLPVNKLFYGNLEANNNNTAWEFAKRMRTKTQNVNFCLPTEAQWEFACRAGSVMALYSGRFVSEGGLWSGRDGQTDLLAWFGGDNDTHGNSAIDGVRAQHPVGQKLPNAFGLYDMLGNVLEFTTDLLNTGSDYISTFGANWQPGDVVVDPNVTATGSKFVLRGGSYSKAAVYCRSGCRRLSLGRWDTPSNDNGMRIALMEE
jgi:formylglycine-generating enzyme required for sulfatase activity